MCDPKIYVADLAAYNSGYLHGIWIDTTLEFDDIQEQITAMLKSSPVEDSEEYAVHDYEGFGGYSVGEYDGIEHLHTIALFIEEHGEIGAELLSHFNDDLDEAKAALDEHYCGVYSSLADYAQDMSEQCGDVPKHLEFYIDYERMGRDMEMSGDIFTIEISHDEVHVFYSR